MVFVEVVVIIVVVWWVVLVRWVICVVVVWWCVWCSKVGFLVYIGCVNYYGYGIENELVFYFLFLILVISYVGMSNSSVVKNVILNIELGVMKNGMRFSRLSSM